MTYLILAFIAVILLLGIALAIAIKVAKSSRKKMKVAEEGTRAAHDALRRLGEYLKKKEEAEQNADEKKETLHTGDDTADFNNSLDVLHNASKNGSR